MAPPERPRLRNRGPKRSDISPDRRVIGGHPVWEPEEAAEPTAQSPITRVRSFRAHRFLTPSRRRCPMFRVQTNPSRSGSRSKHAFRPQTEGLERRRLLSAGDLDTTFDGDGFVTAV